MARNRKGVSLNYFVDLLWDIWDKKPGGFTAQVGNLKIKIKCVKEMY